MKLSLKVFCLFFLISLYFLDARGTYDILYQRDCKYGKALVGAVFKSFNIFPNPTPAECFFRCARDCRCESFQFKQSSTNNSVCQLNEFVRSKNSSKKLVERDGFVFCEFSFAPKTHKDCSCEVDCCNKDVDPCSKDGGKCIANCGSRPRYYCVCADGRIGHDCKFKPKSCLEILMKNSKAKSGYYEIYMTHHNDRKTKVYCDMDPFWEEAWTLVQSFAFSNQHLFHHPFYKNLAFLDQEGMTKYRMTNSWMESIKTQSKKWRATCNYAPGNLDKIDYVVTKFSSIDVLSNTTTPRCYFVDYININNYQCRSCTTWFSQRANENPHFAPKYGEQRKCTFRGPPEATSNSTVFGNYKEVIKGFRCSSRPSDTTQFWFGGKLKSMELDL